MHLGEWYLDRSTGLLSIIPPDGSGKLKPTDEVFVSVNSTIVTLADKTDFTLKDLVRSNKTPDGLAPVARPMAVWLTPPGCMCVCVGVGMDSCVFECFTL